MARRRFFVDPITGGRAVLRGKQAHHLANVLRVEPGQVYELSDGQRLYLGRIEFAKPSKVEFAIERELPLPEPPPEITLLAAIFKFDRMEWMLEKATELGVARIVPVVAGRTSPALAAAAVRRVSRWRRLAGEAARQSRRMEPPEISDPCRFEQALALAPAGRRLILDEDPQTPAGRLESASVLLVGPEGGWTPAERRKAYESGFDAVSLGPLILRAETAAIVALGALMLGAARDDGTLQA